ncbi:8566_t:CDS:2, partial [Racocetra fulgida]
YDWSDTAPIEQDDGPEPLAQIAYDPEYSKAMGYFRAISQKNEHSERALTLTEKIIEHNPAHYTIWQWVIRTFNLWDNELSFVEDLLEKDVRNNSAWNQRYFAIFYNPTKPSEEFLKKEVEIIAKSNIEITVLEELCKTYSQSDTISPHALGCLVDIYEDHVKRGLTDKKELGIK